MGAVLGIDRRRRRGAASRKAEAAAGRRCQAASAPEPPASRAGARQAAGRAARADAARAGSADALALLSPAVRKLLEENNLDPERIPATGKDGRLTKGDVLEFVANQGSGPRPGGVRPSRRPTTSRSRAAHQAAPARRQRGQVPGARIRRRAGAVIGRQGRAKPAANAAGIRAAARSGSG